MKTYVDEKYLFEDVWGEVIWKKIRKKGEASNEAFRLLMSLVDLKYFIREALLEELR